MDLVEWFKIRQVNHNGYQSQPFQNKSSIPLSEMEEILRISIRALEEENERLRRENNRLRNNSGAGSSDTSNTSPEGDEETDEDSDDDSFEAWTVGSRSSIENAIPLLILQPQAQDPPQQAQGLQPVAQDIQRQSTLKFRAYGFGSERLEWISRARVDQTEIERLHFYFSYYHA